MITLYLLGDKSQPIRLNHGLVIGKNWKIFDGKGNTYCATHDRARAEATIARLRQTQPQTSWTLEETI